MWLRASIYEFGGGGGSQIFFLHKTLITSLNLCLDRLGRKVAKCLQYMLNDKEKDEIEHDVIFIPIEFI